MYLRNHQLLSSHLTQTVPMSGLPTETLESVDPPKGFGCSYRGVEQLPELHFSFQVCGK